MTRSHWVRDVPRNTAGPERVGIQKTSWSHARRRHWRFLSQAESPECPECYLTLAAVRRQLEAEHEDKA